MRNVTELDFPTFTESVRETARGGEADAFGITYARCKLMLVIMESLGPHRDSKNQRETERQCTSLVVAKSGEVETPTSRNLTATLGRELCWSHMTKRNLNRHMLQ